MAVKYNFFTGEPRLVLVRASFLALALSLFGSVKAMAAPCDDVYVPTLFENRDFSGIALPIPETFDLDDTQPLYVSDEETFQDRASSLCIPEGWEVKIVETRERDFGFRRNRTLRGPLALDLRTNSFDDRLGFAAAVYVGVGQMDEGPQSPDGDDWDEGWEDEQDPPPLSPPVSPGRFTYRNFQLLDQFINIALRAGSCTTHENAVSEAERYAALNGSVPPEVRNSTGADTLADYLDSRRGDLDERQATVCGGSTNEYANFQELERLVALALSAENCGQFQRLVEQARRVSSQSGRVPPNVIMSRGTVNLSRYFESREAELDDQSTVVCGSAMAQESERGRSDRDAPFRPLETILRAIVDELDGRTPQSDEVESDWMPEAEQPRENELDRYAAFRDLEGLVRTAYTTDDCDTYEDANWEIGALLREPGDVPNDVTEATGASTMREYYESHRSAIRARGSFVCS